MQGKYADADGYDPKGESILNGGEEFVDANSDAYTLTKILRRKGIPTEISVDAELFICNSLLYLTSEYIQRAHLPMKNVFFHTPWTDAHRKREELEEEKTLITQNMLHDAIEAIVMNIE